MLDLLNRLLTAGPAAKDVAEPTLTGRMLVRYALGMGLRLWGDGILNRAAELERKRVLEDTDYWCEQRDAARAELAAVTREVEDARTTAQLLAEEIGIQDQRLTERQRLAYGEPAPGETGCSEGVSGCSCGTAPWALKTQYERDCHRTGMPLAPVETVERYPDVAQPGYVAGEKPGKP